MVKYICAISDDSRYRWEAKVLAVNLLNHGVVKEDIIFLVAKKACCLSEAAQQLNDYATVYAFPDTRTTKNYTSSIRFNLLKQYRALKGGEGKYLYIDSDVIFRKLPDFSLMQEPKVYLSNTISYIGANYIKDCDNFLFHMMCDIIGIDAKEVIQRENTSGGCQYYFASGLPDIFEDCEKQSEELYTKIKSELDQQLSKLTTNKAAYRQLQIWCADMWTLLWNIWKKGVDTEISQELSFSWGSSHRLEYEQHNIFHNAGVTHDKRSEKFYKADFNNVEPFYHDFSYINPDSNTIHYVEAIRAVENYKVLEIQESKEILGVVVLATNNYFPLGIRLINRFSFLYEGNKKLKFFIFSDKDPKMYLRDGLDVKVINTVHNTWDEGTMDKFRCILSLRGENLDYIFYVDADTNISKSFNDEELAIDNNKMTFYKHGFYGNRADGAPPFCDKESTSCYMTYDQAKNKSYHYGAIFYGDKKSMLDFCSIVESMMKFDLGNQKIASWHDESYLNYYSAFYDCNSISDTVFLHSQKSSFPGREYPDHFFNQKMELLAKNKNNLYDYNHDISLLKQITIQ